MNFHVITLFPEVIDAYTQASILGRAQREKLLKVKTYQLRDTAGNKWGKVDERPYGGGPGMVIRAEPIIKAVQQITKNKSFGYGGGREAFYQRLRKKTFKVEGRDYCLRAVRGDRCPRH